MARRAGLLILLKLSAGIPAGPGKSLKVTILTGGVSSNLAGKAFRLDENVILGSNVEKTLGRDPPIEDRRPLGRPCGHKIQRVSSGAAKAFLNLRFLVAVANPAAPGH